MSSSLFVFDSDTPDIVVTQDVKDIQVCTTRIPEEDIDTLQLEAFCQYLGTFQCLRAVFRPDLAEGRSGYRGDVGIGYLVSP